MTQHNHTWTLVDKSTKKKDKRNKVEILFLFACLTSNYALFLYNTYATSKISYFSILPKRKGNPAPSIYIQNKVSTPIQRILQ